MLSEPLEDPKPEDWAAQDRRDGDSSVTTEEPPGETSDVRNLSEVR